MKKRIAIGLLCVALVVVMPLLSACSLFNIDPDKLMEQIQNDYDYDGQYVVAKYYENQSEIDVADQEGCFCVYEIKDNTTFNVLLGDEVLETFAIEGCVCGDIEFCDRNDIFAKFDDDGKMTLTRINADKTVRYVCVRAVVAPEKLVGEYVFKSFRRQDATILDYPIDSNYPEENNYYEQSQTTFEICENQTLKTTLMSGEVLVEKFLYTDTSLIITPTCRLRYVSEELTKTATIDESLSYTFVYQKKS